MYVNALLAFDPVWVVDGSPMKFVSVAIHQFGEADGYGIKLLHKNLDYLKDQVDAFCASKTECYVAAEHGSNPRHCGKHLFIVRHPFDVVLSYAELVLKIDAKERGKKHVLMDVARTFACGQPKYEGHAHMTWNQWMSACPEGVFVRFEDMIKDQVGEVKRALVKCGIEVNTLRDPPTLDQCRTKQDIWYGRGIVGRGEQLLDNSITDWIRTHWKEQMERMGYL